MPTVVLAGTLDTKSQEYAFVRSRLRDVHGVDTVLVDVGILGAAGTAADITRDEVAGAAGTDVATLAAAADRGAAVETMAVGLTTVVQRLHAQGKNRRGGSTRLSCCSPHEFPTMTFDWGAINTYWKAKGITISMESHKARERKSFVRRTRYVRPPDACRSSTSTAIANPWTAVDVIVSPARFVSMNV
jgi:hypothetical protein